MTTEALIAKMISYFRAEEETAREVSRAANTAVTVAQARRSAVEDVAVKLGLTCDGTHK